MNRWLRRVGLAMLACILLLGGAAFAFRPPSVPPEAIETSVVRNPQLLQRAWGLPAATTYGSTVAYQQNGSLCGPTSLANVLRSLGSSVTTSDLVLEGSGKCRTGICFLGLTLDELAELGARQSDVRVTVLRDLDADAFSKHLKMSNDPTRRYIVNFLRTPIFGAGGGHHSPIGGYLEDEDLVFVLDVNHQFRPWLVERERLFAAMNTVDGQSEKKRGLLLIEPVAD